VKRLHILTMKRRPLNEMVLELRACCGRDFGMQVCCFSKHLTTDGPLRCVPEAVDDLDI